MAKYEQKTKTINGLTGEITGLESIIYETRPMAKEPPYIKMYINDLAMMQGLSKTETDILYSVSSVVDYDGIIQITTYTKNKIINNLKIKPSTFANSLNKLVGKMILQRLPGAPRQIFTLNPYFFGKGEWKDIIEQRKAFVVQITRAYGLTANSVDITSFFETIEKRKRDPNTVDLLSGKTDNETNQSEKRV